MNTGFVTQQTRTYRKSLPSVADLDINKVTFGTKTRNKSGQGNHVPIYYDGKPLSFQCRGLFVTFAGTSKKDDNLKVPPTNRSYAILVDAVKDRCKWLPSGVGDGPALYKFQKDLEDLIEKNVLDEKTAESWGCRNKVGKQKMTSIFVSSISEGTEKRDENGSPTGEFYNPSIRLPLRISRDKTGTLVDAFTTNFKTRPESLDLRPSTITTKDGNLVPYGTFAIVTMSYGRMWVGDMKFKITAYVNDVTFQLPEKVELEADDFLATPLEETPVETPVEKDSDELDKELDEILAD